jgi:hypothetical protein
VLSVGGAVCHETSVPVRLNFRVIGKWVHNYLKWLVAVYELINVLTILYALPDLTFTNSTFCPHSVFVWIWEQTAIISSYSINWLVFITEMGCVYCAVRTGSLDIVQTISHYMYHQFNIHKFCFLPTLCICVFCVDLRTNSDYFSIQH